MAFSISYWANYIQGKTKLSRKSENQGSYRSRKTGKGQGILVVRESQGKCKSDWKVREIWGEILRFCTVVVMLIIVDLESNAPYC